MVIVDITNAIEAILSFLQGEKARIVLQRLCRSTMGAWKN